MVFFFFFCWNSQCDRHHWTSDLSSRAWVIEVSRYRSGCWSNRWHDRRRSHLGSCSSFDLFPCLPKTEKVSLPQSSRRTCKWQWRLRTMATTPGTDGEEKQFGSVYSEVLIISDTAATRKKSAIVELGSDAQCPQPKNASSAIARCICPKKIGDRSPVTIFGYELPNSTCQLDDENSNRFFSFSGLSFSRKGRKVHSLRKVKTFKGQLHSNTCKSLI